jgi:hypothetical protein
MRRQVPAHRFWRQGTPRFGGLALPISIIVDLAVSLEGVPQGLVAQHVWARDPEEKGKAKERRKRFTHEKESQRWLDALAISERVIPPEIGVITVTDREADIYALFAQPRRAEVNC